MNNYIQKRIDDRIAVKDVAIHHQALLNRLCNLYAGKKNYKAVLAEAKRFAKEDFEFCYPDWQRKSEIEISDEGDPIIQMEEQQICSNCGNPMRYIPSGISKRGKKYDAFWACSQKCKKEQRFEERMEARLDAEAYDKENPRVSDPEPAIYLKVL